MSDLINKYPYTDFHSVNLDYILKVVRENAGLHLEISGNQLLLKTADNTIISAITIPYATEAGSANTAQSAAYASTAGSASSASYASTAGSAATATNATNAAHATTADSATSANSANSATSAASADYATSAGTAAEATHAASADYAASTGSVEHAEKAFEAVRVDGDNLVFTLGDGTTVQVKVGVANRAMSDYGGNNIRTTYFASVFDDNGTLRFRDALGNVIASVTPSSQVADQDSYGNTIADYIKTIATAPGSNYVTITHGNGTADTILIPYSDAAWKDTNGNVIKNFYAGSMEIVEDEDTGHYNLVVYNGDTPKAELYRFEIYAYKAQEADHADEADHATEADTATTATNADRATTAASADNSAYFIDCYDNNDNSYSIDDPNTIGVDGFYDNAGNSIPLTDITSDDWHNVYFRLRPSQNATYHYTYKVDTTYKVGSPTSPVFFKSRIIDGLQRDNGVDEITFENIEIGILNGAVATSKLFTYTATLTPST